MEELNQNYMEKLNQVKIDPILKYGTVRHYADMFADIIADAHPDDESCGDAIIEAFQLALKEWRQYYEEGAKEIKRIENKVNEEIRLH